MEGREYQHLPQLSARCGQLSDELVVDRRAIVNGNRGGATQMSEMRGVRVERFAQQTKTAVTHPCDLHALTLAPRQEVDV